MYQYIKKCKITHIFLIFLFIGLMGASIAHAQTENYMLVKSIGSEYGAAFNDIAIDSSGNFYGITNGIIEKMDTNGNVLKQFSSTIRSTYSNASSMRLSGDAIDSSGNVYAADPGNNGVVKFDSNGNCITQWGSYGTGNGQFNSPNSVAIDSLGNIYVADSLNYRIEKFDNNGKYLTQWGFKNISNGDISPNGDFSPSKVAIDLSGNVYALDDTNYDSSSQGNTNIVKFDSNGNYLAKLGQGGKGDGQFNGPKNIAIDSSGNVYVADTGNYRIEKFDNNGKYLTQWGFNNSVNGQKLPSLNTPDSVAIDSSGNVYVAVNYSLEEFSQNSNAASSKIAQTSKNTQGNEQTGTGANVIQTSEQQSITPEQQVTNTPEGTSTTTKQSTKTPGFEIISCVTALFAVFLYRRSLNK